MAAGNSDSATQTPAGVVEEALLGQQTMAPYVFPTQKLKRRQTEPGKTPLVLVACGSFSREFPSISCPALDVPRHPSLTPTPPAITFLHLRMFEMASDFVRFNTEFEVCAGYLSPVRC
jgi:nicotinamide mononucleotide adenylyltransferase